MSRGRIVFLLVCLLAATWSAPAAIFLKVEDHHGIRVTCDQLAHRPIRLEFVVPEAGPYTLDIEGACMESA